MQEINNISTASIILLFHFNLLCSGPRAAEGVFIFAGVITLTTLTAPFTSPVPDEQDNLLKLPTPKRCDEHFHVGSLNY